jgi:hypothetical protein
MPRRNCSLGYRYLNDSKMPGGFRENDRGQRDASGRQSKKPASVRKNIRQVHVKFLSEISTKKMLRCPKNIRQGKRSYHIRKTSGKPA